MSPELQAFLLYIGLVLVIIGGAELGRRWRKRRRQRQIMRDFAPPGPTEEQ